MDFQFDATADGWRLKFLKVIDEYSQLNRELQHDHNHPLSFGLDQ